MNIQCRDAPELVMQREFEGFSTVVLLTCEVTVFRLLIYALRAFGVSTPRFEYLRSTF
jgi:hypothetical protein